MEAVIGHAARWFERHLRLALQPDRDGARSDRPDTGACDAVSRIDRTPGGNWPQRSPNTGTSIRLFSRCRVAACLSPRRLRRALNAPLDLILVRKIGVPFQPELAMGAVVDGGAPLVVRNEDVIRLAGIDEADFKAVCDRELAEIERRRQRYLGGRERVEVAGRTAIVIDDGIATGATTRAALRATRMRNPKKLVLAVPVAPTDSLAAMRQEADDVVCLEDHASFGAIGFYYSDFWQVSDEKVIEILGRFPVRRSERGSLA